MPDSAAQAVPATDSATSAWPRWILTGAIGVGAAWIFWHQGTLLLPFILAVVLAYVLEPLVDRLVGWRIPRLVAVFLTIVTTVFLGVFLFFMLVPIVADLAPKLRNQLPELIGRLWHSITPRLLEVGVRVPEEVSDLRPWVNRLMSTYGDRWAMTAINSLRIGGSLLLSVASLSFLVPMIAFYMLLDWKGLIEKAWNLVPLRWRPAVHDVAREADGVMGQYLRGQLLLMLTLAVFYSVALSLTGLELALPIGVFSGLVSCVPYLGYGMSLILAMTAAALQFANDPAGPAMGMLYVGIVYGIGQVLETMYLTPLMVGGRIGLHPVGVLLALVLFGNWMGFAGMLAALPLSALCVVILRRLIRSYQASRWYAAAPPGPGLQAPPETPAELDPVPSAEGR